MESKSSHETGVRRPAIGQSSPDLPAHACLSQLCTFERVLNAASLQRDIIADRVTSKSRLTKANDGVGQKEEN